MGKGIIAAVLLAAVPGVALAADKNEMAQRELAQGDNHLAIDKLEGAASLRGESPGKLINLGIAYARTGNDLKAREMFSAAIASEQRELLKTADGKVVDSWALAHRAMKLLNRGEFHRIALR